MLDGGSCFSHANMVLYDAAKMLELGKTNGAWEISVEINKGSIRKGANNEPHCITVSCDVGHCIVISPNM